MVFSRAATPFWCGIFDGLLLSSSFLASYFELRINVTFFNLHTCVILYFDSMFVNMRISMIVCDLLICDSYILKIL